MKKILSEIPKKIGTGIIFILQNVSFSDIYIFFGAFIVIYIFIYAISTEIYDGFFANPIFIFLITILIISYPI